MSDPDKDHRAETAADSRLDDRRSFDRVAFRIGARLFLPDGTMIDGEIANISLTGLLFATDIPCSHRGPVTLEVGENDPDLDLTLLNESPVGLHLECTGEDMGMRELLLRRPALAPLLLPYLRDQYE